MSNPGEDIPPTTTDPSETALLLNYLQSHDAQCPLCKYNLRNLTVPRCPECGRDITLTVGMKEPYLRALVTFLVAMSLPAGCGLFCFVIWVHELLRSGHLPHFGSREWPIAILFYATMASMVPAALGMAGFRLFMRMSPASQWSLALLAILWDLGLIAILIFLALKL